MLESEFLIFTALIIKETRNDDITVYRLDLSSVWSVRNFAKAILEKEKRLDVLIFNAGIGFIKHERTADNLQLTWQVRHQLLFFI